MTIKKEPKMKRQTYYFKVGSETHKVIAESAGHAMQWMNRQVMDSLSKPFQSWAWMDTDKDRTYVCAPGNYWD
jgi:hypothetical protein